VIPKELPDQVSDNEHRVKSDLFQQVIEQSLNMFAIINKEGNIEYLNSRFNQIFGFSKDEMHGRPLRFSKDSGKNNAIQKMIDEAILVDGRYLGEFEMAKKDGSVLWVRAGIFPIVVNETADYYVCVFHDITGEIQLRKRQRENREMMNAIMENATISITLMDYEGRFTFINRQTEKNLRHSAEELRSKSIVELFPKDGILTLQQVRKVFKTKKPLFQEVTFNIQGKDYYFETNRVPLFNDKGEVVHVMTIARDITEQKNVEKMGKIQSAIDSLQSIGETFEDSLNLLFDNLFNLDWVDAGGLYLVNMDKLILELVYHRGLSRQFVKKTAFYALDSLNAQVAFAKRPHYMTHELYLSSTDEDLLKEKITFVATLPLVYRDNVLGLLNLASRKVSDIDQNERQAVEVIALKVANIIELIKTRMELDQSNEELTRRLEELGIKQHMLIQKSRLESLGELSAGLAHEINQPLSIISLAMENINYKLEQKAASEDYLKNKFTTISQNILKIRELIDHVRIFSRDQGTIMFERVDVNQVIINALSMISSQLKNHYFKVTTDLSEQLGVTIGNPSRFEQVILNLISNARDALEEKEKKNQSPSISKEIRITTTLTNGKIGIKVWDNGMGISSANLQKIFNPFFTTKLAKQGTGLGLPIVYGIVREMKGEITARSEEGVFTEILITLPNYY
jgi:PAS domain S-box-containing protein